MSTSARQPLGGRPAGLDLLPVGVAGLAGTGDVVWMNRTLARRLGPDGPAGHLVDGPGWRIAGPDARGELAALLADADRPVPVGRRLELAHPDGRRASVRVWAGRFDVRGSGAQFVLVLDGPSTGSATQQEAQQETQQAVTPEYERYRLLADHVGDVVLVHRLGRVVWVSPSARQVLGAAPEDLVGRDLAEFTHPDDVARLPDPVPAEPRRHRLRLRHAEHGYRWFSATITGRWNEGHELVEVYAALRDIEDQVVAEDVAAATERRMRMVFEASPDGYAVHQAVRDPDGAVTGLTVVWVNRVGLSTSRLTRAEVIGRDLREIDPVVLGSGLYEELVAALEARTPVPNRRVVDIGAGERIYDGLASPLEDDLLLYTWRDVTDAVEGERMLERAYEETADMRATLQTALDATSDGFAVYALEWDAGHELLQGMRVVHANAAGAMSLGLDPLEMVGRQLHDVLPDVEKLGLWDRIVDAAMTKAPQQLRVHLFGADDEWCSSWDYSVAPVGEERMAITWRDVSAEEGALRQLARHRDEAMHSATHDALTGLPNRTLLLDHLQEALRTCPLDRRVGIVFVDLDRFKAINDTFGHAAGDAVLQATAERLNRLVRHGDLAARLAGDEFVLVLTQLAPDWTADHFFARASALLSEPVRAEGERLHPSASLGVVLADPRSGPVDVDSLIKDADAAMYEYKAKRRARH